MRLAVDLIVFDWDGTLMDSAAKIVVCMQCAARDLDLALPLRSLRALRETFFKIQQS